MKNSLGDKLKEMEILVLVLSKVLSLIADDRTRQIGHDRLSVR